MSLIESNNRELHMNPDFGWHWLATIFAATSGVGLDCQLQNYRK